ncbi:GNRHR [Lepeophtheirus salmonis]|uniref:GNRHR n=1 Tax=Lepeophtheirus salmonis TaxID=72036 RepID=A0A7R8CPN7_LEPSM|nr:GNRHR [Lepeophtheirus salmonis]CAF2841136.1 GNRHR [Lepeophtheirus salmonis]
MIINGGGVKDSVNKMKNCSFQFGNISLAKDHGVTCLGHAPILTTQAFIRTGILGIMSILSFIGNVMAIISVTRNKNRTPLCSLILNLSIADLFVSVFCLCVQAIWTYTVSWNAGNLMCKFVKYWQMFALYLSTFMVVVIGLDRWQAIAHPLKRSRRGRLFNKISCAIAYILSAVLSLPQIAIFRVSKGPFIEEFYQCVTYGFYTAKWQEQIKFHEQKTLRQQKMKRASKKSFKMSLYIIGGFLICWIPYHTVMIVLLFKLTSNKIGQALLDAIFCFGMSNSLFNPIVYGVFHRARNSSSLSHEMTQIKYTKPFYNNRRKRESSRDGCQRNGSSYGKSQATQHEFF